MPKLKIMTVYGTRPEAIKVAPVIKALEGSKNFESIPVVTGQHRQMLDQVNGVFSIVPAHDLKIMAEGQSLNGILSKVVAGMETVYANYCPDVVIVQGDTSTAMGAALAAFNRKIPVVHVEAGLRSGDINSPFPEEANRRIISQISTLHLAPTQRAQETLLREGFDPASVLVTGNTVIDALLEGLKAEVSFADQRIERVVAEGKKIVLVTTHRRENIGSGLGHIGLAVKELAQKYPDISFVVPLHMNPKIRQTLMPYLDGENIIVTEPIAYGDFVKLLSRTHLVLTDSGGIQEEAPSLDIPVLVMRENTERQEGVKAGTLKLVGTDRQNIVSHTSELLESPQKYAAMAQAQNPYGDGSASEKIVAALEDRFLQH